MTDMEQDDGLYLNLPPLDGRTTEVLHALEEKE
jgi:hypothetical protein